MVGPIIICIGLTLSSSAINNCNTNWLIALLAIAVVIICNIWGKGMIKIIPIILGVLGSLVFSGFGTAITGYTQMREVGTSDMQAELALIRLRKELAGAADFPESPFKDSPSVTFTKTDGTQTTISCEDTGNKLLIDGQILLSDVASCRFTTNGAGPSYIGIVLTQQLAERQVTWTLSVAPRNTPLAKD